MEKAANETPRCCACAMIGVDAPAAATYREDGLCFEHLRELTAAGAHLEIVMPALRAGADYRRALADVATNTRRS